MIKKSKQIVYLWLVICVTVVMIVSSVAVVAVSQYGFGNGKNLKYSAEQLSQFPCIYIETQNEAMPVNKKDYVNCSFKITNTENETDAFTVTMKENYGDKDSVGIRLRGNSTALYDKKPYRIKFDKKQSFFGSPKNKSWVLLADYLDPSAMRNYVGLSLAEKFENLDFTPSHHHVVLYINGVCRGLYLLTDQVDEKKGRTNVEEEFNAAVDTDFPFLVEMSNDANSGIANVDYFTIKGFEPIEIKYPEADERDDGNVVYNYIHEYMNAVLTLLKNDNQPVTVSFRSEPVVLSDLVDEESLIDFLLVNEIMGNTDSGYKSIYMHKTANGKIKFGPVWDFDSCAIPEWTGKPDQTQNDLSINNRTLALWGEVAEHWLSITGNQERLYNRFMEKRECILEVAAHMEEYYDYIAPVATVDADGWYGKNGAQKFEEQYTFLERFLLARYSKLATLLRP